MTTHAYGHLERCGRSERVALATAWISLAMATACGPTEDISLGVQEAEGGVPTIDGGRDGSSPDGRPGHDTWDGGSDHLPPADQYCAPPECGNFIDPAAMVCPDGSPATPICLRVDKARCAWQRSGCFDGHPRNDDACGGCATEEYCEVANCGATPEPGTCVPRPLWCPGQYQPVCGCDGNSYTNACQAAGWGVSVAYPGPC